MKGKRISFVMAKGSLPESCAGADIILSMEPFKEVEECRRQTVLLDRWDIWRKGAHAIYLSPEGMRVETVQADRGKRPWTGRQ